MDDPDPDVRKSGSGPGEKTESGTFHNGTALFCFKNICGQHGCVSLISKSRHGHANLPGDYVTRKLATIFGDGDLADELIEQMHAEELGRMDIGGQEPDEEDEE